MADSWVPYEDTTKKLRCAVRARWFIAYPLQRPTALFGATIGEIGLGVLLMALLVVEAVGWETSRSGLLAQGPLILAFMTAAKYSPFTFFLGIPFERRMSFHKMCAYVSIITGMLHGIIAFVQKEATDAKYSRFLWTGCVAIGCALMLALTAFYLVRRACFELFLFFHWVFFLVYAGVLVVHTAFIVLVGVGFWLADVFIRNLYMALCQPCQATLRIMDPDIVEITMADVKYAPGQYAFIAVPAVGIFEWHPISFSSAPCEGPNAKFHIRCNGGWGQRLLAVARNTKPEEVFTVYVDGPYGSCALDIESGKYEHFLFVAGGVGITPLRSVAASIAEQRTRGRKVSMLETHWSVRDSIATAIPMTSDHGLTMYRTGDIELGNVPLPWGVKNGRMNIDKVVRSYKEKVGAAADVRVAVLFCGPIEMLGPLRKACKDHSSPSISFDLHSENFEF
eukprot:TRINITY_DN13087_c0_g1_i1.p1 TRINITY_DN13087_c0_g1~~TRINITY_DN13087_c0_g1_i1.p1  ORF type:complete len:451 (+),score=72.11 TRINITY_DN13087_c0_g1_i1:66-1418(+)